MQIKSRAVFYIVLCQFLLVSCSKDDELNALAYESREDPDIIVSSLAHLAFPDLTFFGGYWYVTFRESDAHAFGSYSKIIIIKSQNFKNWEKVKDYEYSGYDLRDPRFSFNEFTDSLYLHFYAASTTGIYASTSKNFYVNLTNENSNNQISDLRTLKLSSKFPNDWLWRPIWHDGKLYCGGYRHNQVRFYEFSTIDSEPNIISEFNGIGETSLQFHNNEIFCLARQQKAGVFGSTSSKNFEWKELFKTEIGGPNMVIRNDTIFLGARVNSTTSIYSYVNNQLSTIYEFPSRSADCGYPGMFLKDGKIYGVYYTHSIGFQIRKFIL